ncbi:MAG: imidazolonepropionase [candidate division WOR-3 bacterium]
MADGRNSLFLHNCSQILTMSGSGLGIVEQGSVLIREDRILAVGTGLKPEPDEEVIDCEGCVVLPGFVDSHTHLIFGGWRSDEFERRLAGVSYKEIAAAGGGILSTVRATRTASEEELYQLGLTRLQEMSSWGATTVEVKSGYGLETGAELKLLRVARRLAETGIATVVPTFMGAHAIPPEREKTDYVREIVETMLPAVAEQRLARFCDVFCENFMFNAEESRRILEAGRACGLTPMVHADEIEPSGGAEVAARVGAVSASHLLQPSEAGLRLMAENGVVAVLLPGTYLMLREQHRPPVTRMRELGITMAVATDFNPGSCTLVSILLAAQLACLLYGLTVAEALRGITVNGAKALALDSECGRLEPAMSADIVVAAVPDYRHLIYRLGHNPVRMVIRAGRVVYRCCRSPMGIVQQ